MRLHVLLAALVVAPVSLFAQTPESIAEAVASITEDDIRSRIGVIAHDSMLGRYTPSPGLEMTAQYIAAQFESFGLRPGGDDGGYIQRYPLVRERLNAEASVVEVDGGPTWRFGADVVGGGSQGTVSGSAILLNPAADMSQIAPGELDGRIVFMLGPIRNREAYSQLRRHSPAAMITVQEFPDVLWQRLRTNQSTPTERVGESRRGGAALRVQEATAAPLLARHGIDLAAIRSGQNLPALTRLEGLRLTISIELEQVEEVGVPNVVGILEGSDPVMRNEYLVYSAHMDHSGVTSRPVNGDSILNGADDDASGTIGIVELAQAFAMLEPKPKRSIIFVTVSGEERGLWGSGYFAANPPVPVEQMVANLNADMIGRNWPDTIVVIGKEHSDLGATLNRVNEEHPELNMTAIDDLWPEENFYGRSDHIHFARRGVPILFFFNGTHEDYHQPSDEIEKIDAEKEARIVKLMFYLGIDILNADERPQWNPESYERIVTDAP